MSALVNVIVIESVLILWLFVRIYDLKRQLPKRNTSGRFVKRENQ